MYCDKATNLRDALVRDGQIIDEECNFMNFEWSFIYPGTSKNKAGFLSN